MAKLPKPWMLSEEETFSSFRNWRRTILSNLKPEKHYAPYLKDKATWEALTSGNPNRGLADDTEGEKLKKEVKVEHLNDMLGYIAQYSPEELHTEISNNCTSLGEIWQLIREYFGFKQTEAHFLKFSSLKWEPREKPERLYRRIVAHLQDNLLTTECNLTHNKKAPTSNEEMSPTVERLAVIKWMELIDPDLHTLVARTFAHDLQIKTLKDLQPQIRDSIDSLLAELRKNREDAHVSKLRAEEAQISKLRAEEAEMAMFASEEPSETHAFRMATQFNRSQKQRPMNFTPQSFTRPRTRPPAYPQKRKECQVCKAAGRRYMGHTYFECDYVSKAEKRDLVKSCKTVIDEGVYEDGMNEMCDNFQEWELDQTA